MKFCVQAEGWFSSTARRNNTATDVENFVAAHPTWGPSQVEPLTDPDGTPRLRVEVRFDNEADAVALYDNAAAWLSDNQRGWLTGSRVSWHHCPHDNPDRGPCTITAATSN